MLMKPLRGLYEWTMEKASHPHAEWWLAFFCFVESSFFPIPPHPLLGLMCLAEPNKAIRFSIIATLSSVAGALLGPHVFGLVGGAEEMAEIAELGIVMLLFVVGLELSPARLWRLKGAIFGLGLAQVTACGLAVTATVAVRLPVNSARSRWA